MDEQHSIVEKELSPMVCEVTTLNEKLNRLETSLDMLTEKLKPVCYPPPTPSEPTKTSGVEGLSPLVAQIKGWHENVSESGALVDRILEALQI